jgi:hypothetical protein
MQSMVFCLLKAYGIVISYNFFLCKNKFSAYNSHAQTKKYFQRKLVCSSSKNRIKIKVWRKVFKNIITSLKSHMQSEIDIDQGNLLS